MAETEHRIILETGTGNDLYGEDYTKAACRAVQDALHHHPRVESLTAHAQRRLERLVGARHESVQRDRDLHPNLAHPPLLSIHRVRPNLPGTVLGVILLRLLKVLPATRIERLEIKHV